jgi:transferrin binding protein
MPMATVPISSAPPPGGPVPAVNPTLSVATPAPASFGDSPTPAQLAVPGGSSFYTGSGPDPAANTAFPTLATSLNLGSSGVTAVPAGQSATVTAIDAHDFQLTVPAVNVVARFYMPDEESSPIQNQNVLNYAVLGEWWTFSAPFVPQSITEFAFGYETPVSAMPVTGTAAFSGVAFGTLFTPGDTQVSLFLLHGNAALSVDFASGEITGGFTQMTAQGPWAQQAGWGTWAPWNDVSVSASIAAGTNKFTGTTAAASNPQSAASLSGSATGSINGAFYGPTAQELGAIWTLSDGKASAMGGVAASR